MKKVICLLLFLGCLSGLSAQEWKETYEKDKWDIKAVTKYVKSLRDAKQEKQADSIVREYMASCPVVQLEDKDTYLLIGKYVFEDVYSNAFDYAVFAMRRMCWEAGQVDKRYEVLSVLSRKLEREIDNRCKPFYRNEKYVMPDYDSLKVEHLKYLLQKGDFVREGSMQMKVAVYEDYVAKNYADMLQKLWVACDLQLKGLGEKYTMQVLGVLVDAGVERRVLESGIALLHRYADRQQEDMVSCYGILGELYKACGDEENGNRYKQLGKKAEAERMERYGSFIKMFENEE